VLFLAAVCLAADEPKKIPTTMPSPQDGELREKILALAKEFDKPATPVHEVFNIVRGSGKFEGLDMLIAPKPVPLPSLQWTRGVAGEIPAKVEASRHLPEPKEGHIARAGHPIEIDGKLDEAEWKGAGGAAEIPIAFLYHQKPEHPTAMARVLWDDKYLYFGFEVPDENIIATETRRDGPVYKGDCVEAFILPDIKEGVYWEIEVSPIGTIFDCLQHKSMDDWGGHGNAATSTCQGLRTAQTVRGTPNDPSDKDTGYSVEIAVPFTQLPGYDAKAPAAGQKLHLLLCHCGDDGKVNHPYSHVPLIAWFHNIWTYQPFVLDAAGAK